MKRARNAPRQRTVPIAAAAGPGAAESISVPVLPPRNPYQRLARARKAGAHDVDARKRRRIENRDLRQKLIEE